nr:hypothetical protein Iba_chr01dCG6610 [Ipomoea batatas]
MCSSKTREEAKPRYVKIELDHARRWGLEFNHHEVKLWTQLWKTKAKEKRSEMLKRQSKQAGPELDLLGEALAEPLGVASTDLPRVPDNSQGEL